MSHPPEFRRWLVTGSGGQLGGSFVELGSELGIEVVPRTHKELDCGDRAAVESMLQEIRPDVIVNCAAFTAVDLCEEKPDEARRANAEAPAVLARAVSDRVLLIHLSTEYVFSGESGRTPTEDTPPDPISVYGRTKLAGEEAVRREARDHLLVRTQWLFGPGRNFVRTILHAAQRGKPLRVVEDQVGRPTGSSDLARGIHAAVNAGARGTLHLACAGVASWYDLARAVIAEGAQRGLAPRVPVEPISTLEMPRPARRPACAVLDLGRARRLGIEIRYWREALVAYLEAEAEGRDA